MSGTSEPLAIDGVEMAAAGAVRDSPTRILLCNLLFSLAFMKPAVPLLGFSVVASDFGFRRPRRTGRPATGVDATAIKR
jgi:hypothetical protein